MQKLQILQLGGCLLRGPLDEFFASSKTIGRARLSTGGDVPPTYSFGEMKQAIALCRHEIDIPAEIRPLCAIAPTFESLLDAGQFENVDATLIEPATPMDIVFGPYVLHRAALITRITDPIRAMSPEARRQGSIWYNTGIVEGREEDRRSAAEELIRWMPDDLPEPDLIRAVLREARGVYRDVAAEMVTIRHLIDGPIGVVTFIFQYLPDGRPVSWPAQFRQQVVRSAADLGLPILEPWRLVVDFGVEKALKSDLRHYSLQFEAFMGQKLGDFALSVARGKHNQSSAAQLTNSVELALTAPQVGFAGLVSKLADRFRALGIREVVYFHCDHFEPWRAFEPSTVTQRNADDIVQFLESVQRHEYSRRLTLFYHNPASVSLTESRNLIRALPDDQVGFVPRTEREHEIGGQPMRYLRAATGHEIQVHIHHEGFTHTTQPHSPALAGYFDRDDHKSRDAARLQKAIDLWFEFAAREFDYRPERWFFVHGMWALNASDDTACTIENEIEILLHNGCRGDFTFPAGRDHCNPKILVPFFCRPCAGPRAYDLPAATPAFAWGNETAAKDQFFIWNSRILATGTSLDYESRWLKEKLKSLEPFALEIIEKSFMWDGVLFVKTHAHSMHHMYFKDREHVVHPHCYGPILDLYGSLFEAATEAGATVTFATASEVYDRFVTGTPPQEDVLSRFMPVRLGIEIRQPMPHIDPSILTKVSDIVVATATDRIARLGERGSGAEAHYTNLSKRNIGISRHDVDAAQVIRAVFGDRFEVNEIGSGLGSLPLLLSALGIPAFGVERYRARYDTCVEAKATFDAQFGESAASPGFVFGSFPECFAGVDLSHRVAVLTDFVTTMSPEQRFAVIEGLKRYGAVVLDADRFINRRTSNIEHKALIDELIEHGFGDIYHFTAAQGATILLIVNDARAVALNLTGLGLEGRGGDDRPYDDDDR